MSLADLVAAQTQSPSIRCWLASGANYATLTEITPAPISAVYSRAFDQAAATCTLEFSQNLYFQPGTAEQIHVYEGYGSDIRRTFTGFIDDMAVEEHPYKRIMVMRDVMKLAIETWLDDEGVSYINAQAETAVGDLLNRAGLTSLNLGTTNFTIGDINPAKFKLMSIMDAVQQICNLIGWQVWADKNGVVQFQYRKPKPGSVIAWTYERASDGVSSNVLKYKFTATDRDLRNRIVVIGYTDKLGNTIRSEAAAASQYVADPPKYRTAIESSELIDTQSMADWIAGWMLNDLNDLRLVTDLTAVGNPLLDVGATVRLYDPDAAFDQKAFVFSIRSTNDGASGRYEYEMVCIGGVSDSGNYIPPPNHTCPPGYTWNDAGQVCVPNPNLLPPPGDGSLAYVGTNGKGIAKGTNLLTAPTWTAINTGLSNANSKNIITMLFDPWSSNGTQLLGMYALTADGLYKCSDLSAATPTWTHVLSNTTIANLLSGVGTGSPTVLDSLIVPITQQNYVAILAWKTTGDGYSHNYLIYSLDGGTTWNCNTSNWIGAGGGGGSVYYAQASLSQSDVIYCTTPDDHIRSSAHPTDYNGISGSIGNPTYFKMDFAGAPTALSQVEFSPYVQSMAKVFLINYTNDSMAIIGDDKHVFWVDSARKGFSFTNDIFTPVYSSGPITDHTNRFDAGMGIPGGGISIIDFCTWDISHVYWIHTNNSGVFWATADKGTTWHSFATNFGSGSEIRSLSALPSNNNFCLICGEGAWVAGGATWNVALTLDNGATFTNITANLITALGLVEPPDEAKQIKPDWIWVTPGQGG